MSEKFEKSKAAGAHKQLERFTGEWEGTTKTWFEPDKLADESPMKGTIKSILGGQFVQYDYQGTMGGKPFEGVMLLGHQLSSGEFKSAWVDSFHTGTDIMYSKGKSDAFNVLGSYAYGDQHWGWRTTMEMNGDDELIITMYNITPEGQEAKGVETRYKRKK